MEKIICNYCSIKIDRTEFSSKMKWICPYCAGSSLTVYDVDGIDVEKRLEKGRQYLENINDRDINVQDCLRAFGFTIKEKIFRENKVSKR